MSGAVRAVPDWRPEVALRPAALARKAFGGEPVEVEDVE